MEANDAGATFALGNCYRLGQLGLQQNEEKATDLYAQAAKLRSSNAHYNLGDEYYHKGGNLKKEQFNYEAAAMA